ncbi:putative glucan 1,3-alpha-glucosidase [Zea mays]|uniref:Glucosidase II subunit alpha n=1 Tax=Zea mays TaxID=4577 RepID=A0A317Y689_MAIZE|nr:putative glucan 1,3-alpha-glucosidase [Zea mays]
MDPPRRRLPAALVVFLLLLAAASPVARAWKKDEFRNCNQTPFCKRARTRAPHSLDAPLSLAASSLAISPDGSISAELSHPSRPRPLVLRLSALPPHALRLQIDEDYSTATPPHRRFHVPDVLLPDLEARTLHLPEPKTAAGVSTVALSSDLDVVVRHDPFELAVRRAGSGDPVLSFNSHGLFDFEPMRESKPEDDTWEEHFRSHTDKRPRGPQSITFDLSFYGADFVYGLPEHGSTSLALRPTRGPGVEESEPYRLFNLDVFEYLHESPFGLYGSIPFMIGHGGRASSGFFWLNAAEMQIDVLAPGWDGVTDHENGRIDTLWMAEAGVIDAFFFVDAGFDEHDIPYDVLWLDIEHTDGKRYFTWDHSAFPNPEEMQRKIADKGRKMVTIVDPHIKRDISTGADIGGFFGNPEPDLLVRWYQVGAFYPFFRGHAHHDTKRREPWLFGERRTAIIREAIHMRYSLLPYFYTLFREASVNGIPVMRPLWLEFPDDKETYNNGEAFMVGPSLLAQGIYEEGQKSVSVYLPGKESWYDLRNGSPYKGSATHKLQVLEDSIPSFQRAGTIVPRKDRFRRSSTQMVNDPYTLVIALNSSGAGEGELYVDDGKSYEYQQGAFIHRRFVFADNKLTSFNIGPDDLGKKFRSDCVIERIIILGLRSGVKKAIIEPGNQELEIESGPISLRSGSSPVAPTIRRPNVCIADSWTIRIA